MPESSTNLVTLFIKPRINIFVSFLVFSTSQLLITHTLAGLEMDLLSKNMLAKLFVVYVCTQHIRRAVAGKVCLLQSFWWEHVRFRAFCRCEINVMMRRGVEGRDGLPASKSSSLVEAVDVDGMCL